MRATTTTLRERIESAMPRILDILKPENLPQGFGAVQGDVRPWVISIIKSTAEAHATPRPASRGKQEKIAKKARGLRNLIRGTEHAHIDAALARVIEESEARLRPRRAPARAPLQVAASQVFHLMEPNGGAYGLPTLAMDGAYFRLIKIVHEAATGQSCSDSAIYRAASAHFDGVNAEFIELLETPPPYASPPDPTLPPTERPVETYPRVGPGRVARAVAVRELEMAWIEERRARRIEEARSFPPLDRLLDELLYYRKKIGATAHGRGPRSFQ